ncbi:unnamed protein product [Rhizophagus irregularis]|nr:unnamed protein product [Rhizophagus irregularis]
MTSSDLFRPKIDTTVRRNWRLMKTTQTNLRTFLRNYVNSAASSKFRHVRNREYGNYATNEIDALINAPRWTKDGYNGSLKQLIEKYNENKCSPPEEDDQAGEDENQEVVDENQEEVEENQEDEEENQEDEEEDQNKNKRGISVVSSEYDSISSE